MVLYTFLINLCDLKGAVEHSLTSCFNVYSLGQGVEHVLRDFLNVLSKLNVENMTLYPESYERTSKSCTF